MAGADARAGVRVFGRAVPVDGTVGHAGDVEVGVGDVEVGVGDVGGDVGSIGDDVGSGDGSRAFAPADRSSTVVELPSTAVESAESAAWQGLIDSEDDDMPNPIGVFVEATEEHRRHTWVLFTLEDESADPRVTLYLARVRNPRTDDGTYEREGLAKLYENAVSSEENDCDYADFDATSELRIRDVDRDGEVEATVIAAVADVVRGEAEDQCGRVAFIVGADMQTQARFTREYHRALLDAGGETYLSMETRWRFEDQNEDGHADLHVIDTYRYRSDFEGDYAGEGYGTMPGSHERKSERRTVDCPWDEATDRWLCPADPVVGQQLFTPIAQRGQLTAPW